MIGENVRVGQPMRLKADEWNRVRKAADWVDQRRASVGVDGSVDPLQTCVALVRNDSGDDLGRFAALTLGDPLILPSDNEEEFAARITFAGTTPTAAGRGRFAITLEPAASGAVVRAVLAGVVACKVDAASGSTVYRADVAVGENAHLKGGLAGSAEILWRASGAGPQWAMVRLGTRRPPPYRRVILLEDLLVGGHADAEVVCDDGGSSGSSGGEAGCCRSPSTIRVWHAFGCGQDGTEVVAEAGRMIGVDLNEDLNDEIDGSCGRYEATVDDCEQPCDSSGSDSSGDDGDDGDGDGSSGGTGPPDPACTGKTCVVRWDGFNWCLVSTDCVGPCSCFYNGPDPGMVGFEFELGCVSYAHSPMPNCM